ncbi:MAG: hypothetical protein GY740_14935, partial [Gammaproteobacteria bacterium]|nr:hypothetical protein [Gammaproteobacteria bacterium]
MRPANKLEKYPPLPDMSWFVPPATAPRIHDQDLQMKDRDLFDLTPQQRGEILNFPKDDSTFPFMNLDLNQAPIHDLPYRFCKAMRANRLDGQRSYHEKVKTLTSFVDFLPQYMQPRCRRNTLLLGTFQPNPRSTSVNDLSWKHGFIETYEYRNGRHTYHYESRPENYCYRKNYLMLKAYEGCFIASDMALAATNAAERERHQREKFADKPQITAKHQPSPEEMREALKKSGYWGKLRPELDTDERAQQALSRHLPPGTNVTGVTARHHYDRSQLELPADDEEEDTGASSYGYDAGTLGLPTHRPPPPPAIASAQATSRFTQKPKAFQQTKSLFGAPPPLSPRHASLTAQKLPPPPTRVQEMEKKLADI